MARSVSYLSNAIKVSYTHVETEYKDEDTGEYVNDEFAWDDFMDNLKSSLQTIFPSLYPCDRWGGREDHIILENSLVEIAVSEYCGLVAVSVRVNETRDGANIEGIATNWINKNWHKAETKLAEFADVLKRVGAFSNGESVFEKVNK